MAAGIRLDAHQEQVVVFFLDEHDQPTDVHAGVRAVPRLRFDQVCTVGESSTPVVDPGHPTHPQEPAESTNKTVLILPVTVLEDGFTPLAVDLFVGDKPFRDPTIHQCECGWTTWHVHPHDHAPDGEPCQADPTHPEHVFLGEIGITVREGHLIHEGSLACTTRPVTDGLLGLHHQHGAKSSPAPPL